jgi:Tfp pilus assembly protein PilN
VIKVNLLKNRAITPASLLDGKSGGATGATGVSTLDGSFDTFESSLPAQVLKLILLLGFVCSLVVYEKLKGDEGKDLIAQKNAQIESLQAEQLKQEQEVAQYQGLSDKKESALSLDNELSLIKSQRLKALKGIDTLQSLVPKNVWLTLIRYNKNSLELDGQTLLDSGLDKFVSNIKSESLFDKINVRKDVKAKSTSGRVLNEFKVTMEIVESEDLDGR